MRACSAVGGLLCLAASTIYAQDVNRGIKLFDAFDRAGARTQFEAAVRKNDSDARAHYYLGRLSQIENDPDAAVDRFEKAVKLDDRSSLYHEWLGRALSSQAARASMFQQMALGPKIKAEFERAVELDPRSISARDALVDFYALVPAAMGGGLDKAHAHAEAIGRLDAMRGHYALGRIAAQSKDTVAVEREMNAAITAAPDTLRIYSALATWYVNQKEWTAAFATIDRYIKRRPADPYGPNQIGRVAAASGQQLARGEQGIRAFIAKPPKDAAFPTISTAWFRLGRILEQQGKTAEAQAAYEKAVKMDPRNEDAKKALK